MKLFRRGEDERREKRQFHRDITTAHIQSKAGMNPTQQQEVIRNLGNAYLLQEDDKVMGLIAEYCLQLLPAFSRLNATSKIDKPKDRRLMQLLFKDLLLHEEMELGDEGDVAARSLIKALGINAEYRIYDCLGGYRGHLVTEEIERTHHVIEEPKKKGFL